MQVNQYTAYSVISSTENKNSAELEKVLLLIETLSEIKTIEKAKDFLREKYQIKDAVQEFPLGANSFLNIKENTQKYSIRISYTNNDEKECKIYSYKK